MGGPAANLTAVMSGQVDVGWAAPPFGLDQLDRGDIRRIATGNDASVFKGQTVRLNIANAAFLKEHKAIVDRYMKAYRETVDYMYQDPTALKIYSEWLGITVEKAKRTRDEFFPPPAIEPDTITGLDTIVKDAVDLKYTAVELTKEQLGELIQIPVR
jgi:NitT/TauT family transport system substrate-binding protein